MPSSVPTVKKGLRDYWRTVPGLTPADKVTIRSAPVDPKELAAEQITLGDVTAPQSRPGLAASKAETPTMTGWIEISRPGADEAAIDAARDRAYQLLDLIEASLQADQTAAGAVRAPAYATVSESALEEYPVPAEGAAGRRAVIRFSITWTSHGI